MSDEARSSLSESSRTFAATSAGSVFFSKVRLGLPTAARMRSMSSRMGCAVLCANMRASMMSPSAASAAPPSTITIASLEQATTRSMSPFESCSKVG